MTDTLTKNFIVDTNILVYYFDLESEFHSRAIAFIKYCIKEKIVIYIAQQNLIELANVLLKDYKKSGTAVAVIVSKLQEEQIIKVILPTLSTPKLFLKILQKQNRRRTFDLYLAATAIDNGINRIVTNNPQDFAGIPKFSAISLAQIGDKIRSEHERVINLRKANCS